MKSEWDDEDDDDDEQINRQRELLFITPSSSTSKRPSSLKKSTQLSSSIKSPKSVTFSLDENLSNQQEKRILSTFELPAKEKSFNQFFFFI